MGIEKFGLLSSQTYFYNDNAWELALLLLLDAGGNLRFRTRVAEISTGQLQLLLWGEQNNKFYKL